MENPSPTTRKSLPMIAFVGPTNAGKSTLFNRLTGSWQAITAREESTTRDRIYGRASWQNQEFIVVDTGGIVDEPTALEDLVRSQMLQAIEEADIVMFVFDAQIGLRQSDQQFLQQLRNQKTIWLVANKVDSPKIESTVSQYNYLGWPYHEISAISGRGVGDLLESLGKELPTHSTTPRANSGELEEPIVAIAGRPNVGKSSLLNALVRKERAVVSPVAGTTRDIVTEKLTIGDRTYLLADTAGVRRRGKIEVGTEKFSVKRTLAAITDAKAVIVMVDATTGTTRGDLHLIYFAEQLEKPVLIVFNKIDLVGSGSVPFHQHTQKFDQVYISATEGLNLKKITDWLAKNVK